VSLLPPAVDRLAEELGRLPGIGPKTAQRLAFHAVRMPADRSRRLEAAVAAVRDEVGTCPECFFIAAPGELCAICRAPGRDPRVLCVVTDPSDVLAIERAGEYRGRYHVLGGTLSPIDGVGPEALHLHELVQRIPAQAVREVILATDSDVEGEATASYVIELLAPLSLELTRLAHGLPVGGELAYADERTVARAFSGRLPV